MNDIIYVVETPDEIFWSKRKLTTQFKHLEFLWRDRAKYKELTPVKWGQLKERTSKKVWELVG
jgi:hypothetical protein